jgi:hypothetical protein
MAYRVQTHVLLGELDFRLLLDQRAPANESQYAETDAACPELEEAEHLLHWLRASFGCETG